MYFNRLVGWLIRTLTDWLIACPPPYIPPPLHEHRRSKLYVFGEAMLDKGTGKKTWLERGIGEVKLLKYVRRRIKFDFCGVFCCTNVVV